MSILKKVLVLVVILAIGYFLYGRFIPHGGQMPQGGAAPVSVAEVIGRDVQQWHEFSGRLVAVDQVDIRPQVSGTIEKILFKDGQLVKKGDLLIVIDPRPFEAVLAAAQATASLAESDLKRGESLMADKAIPQHDYDQRKNNAAVARAALATARLNLDYTHIVSPISGKVGRAEITQGNLVETGGSAPVLTTVVANDPIYADFDADEATFLQYAQASATSDKAAGQVPVKMGLMNETGTPHAGRIQSFDNRMDNASGTIRMRGIFPNPDGTLVPGLFARINLGSSAEQTAVLISDRAIGTDQDRKFVLVVGKDNKVEHREVKLAGLADGLRMVTDGLKPGEKIIVSGMQRVMMPGQAVTPEDVPMEGEAPAKGDKPKPEEAKQETSDTKNAKE